MILAVVSLGPLVALAAASLTVTPALASAGSSMTATGSGFQPGEGVAVYLDGVPVGLSVVGEEGSFVATFSLSLTISNGRHTVTAVAPSDQASASFTVSNAGDTTTTTEGETTTTTTTTTTPPTTTIISTSTLPLEPPPTGPVDPTTTVPGAPVTIPTTTTPASGGSSDTSTPATTSPRPPATTAPPPTIDVPTTTVPSTGGASITDISIPADPPGAAYPWPTLAYTDETARLAGASIAVGTFTVSPPMGPVGTQVTLNFGLDGAIPGLTVVEVRLGGRQLGEVVPITNADVSVQRTVPALAPGAHLLTVEWGDLMLASTTFEVTGSATQGTSPTTSVWLLPLALLVALLTWVLVGLIREPGRGQVLIGAGVAGRLRRALTTRR